MKWYLQVFKKYADFKGRARRKEYWMFLLFNMIFTYALLFLETLIYGIPILTVLYSLVVLVPSLAVVVRRLHDIGKSGAYFFVGFIPLIGGIWLLILMVTAGEVGENQYGPDPKQEGDLTDDATLDQMALEDS